MEGNMVLKKKYIDMKARYANLRGVLKKNGFIRMTTGRLALPRLK
jgi:hypothetical protein